MWDQCTAAEFNESCCVFYCSHLIQLLRGVLIFKCPTLEYSQRLGFQSHRTDLVCRVRRTTKTQARLSGQSDSNEMSTKQELASRLNSYNLWFKGIQIPGRRATVLQGDTQYFWVFSMELSSHHPPGSWNFEMAPMFGKSVHPSSYWSTNNGLTSITWPT
jgi:hypothetical protein